MQIKINEEYIITSDDLQYRLQKPETYVCSKTGETKEQYRTLGYFSTLEGLLRSFKRRFMCSSDASNLEELLSVSQEADGLCRNILDVKACVVSA